MADPKKKVIMNVGERVIESKSGSILPNKKPVRLDADEADKLLELFKGELIDTEAETKNLESQITEPVKTKPNPIPDAPKEKPDDGKSKKKETAEEKAARKLAEEQAEKDLAAEAKEKNMTVEDLKILKSLEAEEAAKNAAAAAGGAKPE